MKKLIIDIPDQIYDDIKRYRVIFAGQTNDVLKSVVNGVPLNEEDVKLYIKQIKENKNNENI